MKGGDAFGGINLMAKASQFFSEGWLNFFKFLKGEFL
jgi:hypothetical protein